MKFGQLLKNMAKGAVGFFVVGALLTVVAQALAPMMGLDIGPLTLSAAGPTNPMWNGAYFGAFGALNQAITPVVEKFMGAGPVPKSPEERIEKEASLIAVEPAPELSANHAQKLETQRELAASAERQI